MLCFVIPAAHTARDPGPQLLEPRPPAPRPPGPSTAVDHALREGEGGGSEVGLESRKI